MQYCSTTTRGPTSPGDLVHARCELLAATQVVGSLRNKVSSYLILNMQATNHGSDDARPFTKDASNY